MLEINDIQVTLGKKIILNNLSLTIDKGEIVGLVAPNGYGKTTLLKTIAELEKIDRGNISLFGKDIHLNSCEYRKLVFFSHSSDMLYQNLTVLDHLNFAKNAWESPKKVLSVISELQMNHYMNKKVKNLSLGMKQHLLFAMAIISNAQLILMDEPFNGLDPTSVRKVSKLIYYLSLEGKCFLFSSHILYHIDQICSKVFFLDDQKISFISDLTKERFINTEQNYTLLFEGG